MVIKFVEFISACPCLEGKEVRVNGLDRHAASVSVKMTKNKKSIRDYADGGGLKVATFVVAMREVFAMGDMENRRIAEKCSLVENWIEEQNLNGNLPKFSDDISTVSVGVSKCFEIVRTDGVSARYEAEVEVTYYTP